MDEREIKILDFLFKQDNGLLTEDDWKEMDEIQKNNPNYDIFKKTMK